MRIRLVAHYFSLIVTAASFCAVYIVLSSIAGTSEAGVQFPARPQVGKLVVACRCSAVYSTEP